MNLKLSYSDLNAIYLSDLPEKGAEINSVAYDTRKVSDGTHTLFFCLKGTFRDGHEFIEQAYVKGVRTFVVESMPKVILEGANFVQVPNSLEAIQKLAKHHRDKFDFPIIAITGSSGKTIVKEWLAQILQDNFNVVRSPKSYNSQLGVALSLLELSSNSNLAIIEAGISQPGEMGLLEKMIQPTYGILTNIGSAHSENFNSEKEQLEEKLKLFTNVDHLIVHESVGLPSEQNYSIVSNYSHADLITDKFSDAVSKANLSLAIEMAKLLNLSPEDLTAQIAKLQPISLRLETFDGIDNSLIINDTYSLDIDAFRSSLEYQLAIAGDRKRIVVVDESANQDEIKSLINNYQPIEIHFVKSSDSIISEVSNGVILIKGTRSSAMEKHASKYRLKKHQTFVEIDLNAVRSNIEFIKSRLPSETKVLTMVKASSYGSGGAKMAVFLERIGVDYLGVAYTDEGVDLRKAGVKLPILVMNAEEAGFEECIQNNLEPAIFSLEQLELFIKECIYLGKTNYPIHIKLETGMNRLGFTKEDIPKLIDKIQSQPEVKIQSIYSHLATADEPSSVFVEEQVNRFKSISEELVAAIPYAVDRHILNSEGSLNYPNHHFDMVRIGIGMYGYTSNAKMQSYLSPVIKWKSSISQLKHVAAGESVGYGRSEIVERDTVIAIIPVGYADGYRRSLSKGKGGVYHNFHFAPVIGNVCMDMIMVDVTSLDAKINDTIEIIGDHQSLEDLAQAMDTIPYEVLTGISKRVHRVYLED